VLGAIEGRAKGEDYDSRAPLGEVSNNG
jgi:hypothetical protein